MRGPGSNLVNAVHGQHAVPVGGSRVSCMQGHECLRVTGIPDGYGGIPRCDHCGQEDLHELEHFYHCAQCSFDVCQACANILN